MKITLIGSGKLATHLGQQLFKCEHQIVQVFSRNLANAQKLAETINAEATNNLAAINNAADVYIIAVNDDAIETVAAQLTVTKLLVHTSGSVSTEALNMHKSYGSFYPLQSFSPNKKPNWDNLPVLVYANTETAINQLQRLANSISNNFEIVNNTQRQQLHLAAVFANNFSNYLFSVAEDLLSETNLSLDLLKPLIIESVKKIETASPKEIQTGPAVRNDVKTINKHLEQLGGNEDLSTLYQLFTKLIRANNKSS